HFVGRAWTVMTEVFQSTRAKIIRTTLQDRKSKIKIKRLAEVGKIALDELILQVDRICGDDHTCIVLQGEQRCRHEVCKTFPYAGSGFNHQMASVGERVGHCSKHRYLFRALFEQLKIARERSSVLKGGGDFIGIKWDGILWIGERREFRFIEPHTG